MAPPTLLTSVALALFCDWGYPGVPYMTALSVSTWLYLLCPGTPLNGRAHRHTHTHPHLLRLRAWGSHPFPASGDLRHCTCSPGGPIPSTEEKTQPWEGLPWQQPRQASRSQRDQGTACLRLKASRPAQICRLIPNWTLQGVSQREILFLSFNCSVVFNSLRPHGLQPARLPCPSSPGVYSNSSCPLSR